LLGQIELRKKGDVYQPGATYYFNIAKKKGFIDYEKFVAYHVPVIAVPKGNPGHITCLKDLARPGIKVAFGDPKACAIGRLGNKILKKNGIKDAVEKNVVTRAATVNVLIVNVSMGLVDAAITWEESVLFAPDKTDIIEIPKEENIIKVIPIGTLAFSQNKDHAKSSLISLPLVKEKPYTRNMALLHIPIQNMSSKKNSAIWAKTTLLTDLSE